VSEKQTALKLGMGEDGQIVGCWMIRDFDQFILFFFHLGVVL